MAHCHQCLYGWFSICHKHRPLQTPRFQTLDDDLDWGFRGSFLCDCNCLYRSRLIFSKRGQTFFLRMRVLRARTTSKRAVPADQAHPCSFTAAPQLGVSLAQLLVDATLRHGDLEEICGSPSAPNHKHHEGMPSTCSPQSAGREETSTPTTADADSSTFSTSTAKLAVSWYLSPLASCDFAHVLDRSHRRKYTNCEMADAPACAAGALPMAASASASVETSSMSPSVSRSSSRSPRCSCCPGCGSGIGHTGQLDELVASCACSSHGS